MSADKETLLTISPDGKESMHDRIKSLFRGRSMRKVASDWGLAYSTLNNYFVRSASPNIEVLILIAMREGVSLEWLATGRTLGNRDGSDNVSTQNEVISIPSALMATWQTLFDSLKEEEVKALLSLIMRMGVNGLLELAESKTSIDSAFLHLDEGEKERLWALHEAKKGTFEGSEMTDRIHPQAKEKQAS
ncbi:TPA: helix-turn-helix domain-containing protein [Raoultella ornithinolytica]|uniref:helix-turn-helix domain-containing protein n=1 Tax=Klebsiella quasipneumoniae TaxID=1463165 RepID=UPI0011B75E46|nr:helix-turn-helix domain-containing protein [Klebsiella quasipneumoniae]TWV30564.1 bacteriophage CI repressor [Klebsiella quasipneumoniae subsp. similipneumoniae]